MKKNKLGVFALGIASLGFLTCLTSGETKSSSLDSLLPKDATFLVSLSGTEASLGNKGVKETQKNFESNLKELIGNNFTVVETYDAINAIKIKTNKAFQSTISSLPGVEKVALNQKYRFGETYNGERTQEELAEGFIPYANSDTDIVEKPTGNEKNQSLETMNVPTSNKGGAGSLIAILDSGYFIEHTAFTNFTDAEFAQKAHDRFNYSDLKSKQKNLIGKAKTQLDEAEADKLFYQNPKLADGSTYYNLKIPFYYDYGGSSLNEGNDFDVLTRVSEHGTHVASIAGANGTYKGVAPNAQLALMKVFFEQIPTDENMSGGVYATEEDIVEALNDCAVLGVDTLNMSLGTDLDDFSDKTTAVSIMEKLGDDYGVLCNISAGNSGKALFKSMNAYKDWATDQVDTGILGSYAVSDKVNVIASSTNPTQYYEKGLVFNQNGKNTVVGYDDQVEKDEASGITEEMEHLLKDCADENGNIELVTAGLPGEDGNYYGDAASYQKATQYNSDAFKDKVVVVDRGSNSFLDKATQAEENGAKGLIVINNDPTAIEFTFGMSWTASGSQTPTPPNIPVVFVLYRDRDFILNKCLSDAKNIEGVTYAKSGSASIIEKKEEENPDKDQLSDFSSDGSTSDLRLNPTISAPGTSIRGATLGKPDNRGVVEKLNEYSYEYLSGTSMSAPNFTGVTALMIGEQDFASNEERVAYMKSLTMRTMSTATQYESTSYIYDKINVKKAKTTGDYVKDVLTYVPAQENTDGTTGIKNTAPYTPRKEGSGVVNVSKALNSKVYLEGLKANDDGSFSDTGLGHSKIELKNNKLIKDGKIKVGFNIHSDLEASTTYNIKMKVMAPEITSYHSHDNSLANYVGKDTNLEGAKLQTVYDKVLETINLGSVTLEAGANKVQKYTSEEKTINDETKKYLEHFENGTFIEGYVYLVPEKTDEAHGIIPLSIPFLGFYGDYGQADATEPFNFEKEVQYNANTAIDGQEIGFGGKDQVKGKLYGSDLVNTLGKNGYLLDTIDTSSMIAADSFDNYNNGDKQSNIVKNSDSISNFANEIVTKKDSEGKTTLYVGGDKTDVLYIQEYVYRSILSETVEIFDKFGNIVVKSNVKDIVSNTNELYKSIVVTSLMADRSFIHRGYCELPLYNSNTGVKLPNGNYTIKFTYNLIYGSKQTKEYGLVIDGLKPYIAGKTILNKGDKKILRLKFSELYIDETTKVHVNADITTFTLTKVSDGYLVDIVLDEAFENDKLFVQLTDASLNSTNYMINLADQGAGLSIESETLTFGSTYSYTKTSGELSENVNINDTYEISAKDYKGNELNLSEFTALITLSKKVNSSVQVLGINESGEKKTLNFDLLDSTTIRVTTDFTKIQILDEGGYNNGFVEEDDATIIIKEANHGKVFSDRTTGRKGDVGIIYAIADKGYVVDKVIVNGQVVAPDQYGNYIYILKTGENIVEVTFKEAK